MSNLRAPIAAAAFLAALGSTSCAVGVGPGYGDSGYVGVEYSGDYYDPCCYGGEGWGWGGRYHVGPPPGRGPHGGGPRPGGPGPAGGGRGGGGRAAPSIPGGHPGGGGHPR